MTLSTLGYVNPFRYRGYVFDEETGLYFLRSRYYNPVWGRFVNADILVGQKVYIFSHNIYVYCENNASSRIDVTGKSSRGINEQVERELASLNAEEQKLFQSNSAYVLLLMYIARENANNCVNKYFKYEEIEGTKRAPTDMDGTLANAFKHASWNAFMTKSLGYQKAYDFATAHE